MQGSAVSNAFDRGARAHQADAECDVLLFKG